MFPPLSLRMLGVDFFFKFANTAGSMALQGIIAFDIDGTLTHQQHVVDEKVIEFLRNLNNQEWQIALLTGRTFTYAEKILKSFPFPFALAIQNGADILKMPSKELIRRRYLSSKILPQIEKAYQKSEEDFIIYGGIDEGDFCYYRPNRFSKTVLGYLEILKSLSKTSWKSSEFSFVKETFFPLIKCFGDKRAMQFLNHRLIHEPGIDVSMIVDPIDPKLCLNLITHHEANKGNALGFLREFFQAPVVIAAGDDQNDLKMLKEADVSIAIETAPQEILNLADIYSKPADKLGIIQATQDAITLAKRKK